MLPLENKTGMIEEYEKRKRKQLSSMKTLVDYGMGTLFFIAGLFFLLRNLFSIGFNERFPPNELDTFFGVLCIIYGSWRLYRGYKKKYNR